MTTAWQHRDWAETSFARSRSLLGRVIPTPTEESFFEALESPYWLSEQRTKEHIRAYLWQTKG